MTDNKQNQPNASKNGPLVTPAPSNDKNKSTDANKMNKLDTNTTKTSEQKDDALRAEIKKSWGKLSDADIGLYEKESDKFFSAIKEQYGTSKEEAQKKFEQIKTDCGCGSKKVA